jgi:hypothetical protein
MSRRMQATCARFRPATASAAHVALLAAILAVLSAGAQPLAAASAPAELRSDAIRDFAQQLIAIPDREMGSPGALTALALIEAKLQDLGLRTLRVRTTVSVPIDLGCTLQVDDRIISLLPQQSNLAATAGTGGRIITGHLVFVGQGTLHDLAGKPIAGNIIVLDGDSGSAWTTLAGLGAAAVVFRNSAHLDRFALADQAIGASIGFPRFVADLDPDLDGQDVRIHGTVRWEPRPAWSLLATIPGRALNHESVVLCSGYEANGPVPGLNHGATRAWNASLLVEIAANLARNPTERGVVLVFHGGRGEMFRGLTQLIAAVTLDRDATGMLAHDNRVVQEGSRALSAAARAGLVADVLAHVGDGEATSAAALMTDLGRSIATDLTPMSDDERDDLPRAVRTRSLLEQTLAVAVGGIADARLDVLDDARQQLAHRVPLALTGAQIDQLKVQIRAEEPECQAWRDLQQRLDNGKPLSDREDAMISQVLPIARRLLARHREVIDERAEDIGSLSAARAAVADQNIIHLVALDLSDGARAFSSISGGFYVTWDHDLGWMHKALLKLAGELSGDAARQSAYDPAPQQLSAEAGAYWPADYLHDSGVVGALLPALTLSTTNDVRAKLGSPLDDAPSFRADNFLHQAQGLLPLLRAYVDCADIANRRSRNIAFSDRWIRVETRANGSMSGRRPFPFPFSVVLMGRAGGYLGDVRAWQSSWGDLAGESLVQFLPNNMPGFSTGLNVRIYGFDEQGPIIDALASDGLQASSRDLQFSINWQARDILALVFRAVPSQLYNAFDPRLLLPLPAVTALSPTRNAQPNFAHIEVDQGQVALFSEADQPLMVSAAEGRIGNRLVLLGAPGSADGAFKGHATGLLSTLTALDVARDMWLLDDQRLALLRRNGISSDSLVTLHSRAERSLDEAQQAFERRDYATATGAAQTSWAYTSRVYPSLLSTANDVVYGLVILLAFAIPFSVIGERLFLSGSTVARRAVGFSALFIAVFLFFYAFHPAFSLATTPMIIFLAFLILVMSVWTISLLYSRFEAEMEGLRMAGMGMHKVDVSRLGTLLATIELGISNMRRRPLRTVLTGVTVVLMTFILLTFSSFSPAIATQRIAVDTPTPYSGIMIRFNGWSALPEAARDEIESQWGARFNVTPLRWLQATPTCPRFPIAGAAGSSFVAGVIGCSPGDPMGIERALVRGELGSQAEHGFPKADGGQEEWIFLPEEVLRRIGVAAGGTLRFRGCDLRAGVVDPRLLAGAWLIGGEPPTPLALSAYEQGQQDGDRLAKGAEHAGQVETATLTHLGPTNVAVVSDTLIARLGGAGSLRALVLTPRSNRSDIEQAAEAMAQQLAVTLRVSDRGESYLLTGVGRLTINGLGSVLVPLVLGGLIIFTTMLNSVAERGRDIFIFASLGLAPIHVAALFLVEAGIYAVMGGVGGYLLAQLGACLLGALSHLGIGAQPDLNYSSFTAVATMLVVMATVLVSALYPALVASRAASPGTSDFRIPEPVGDRIEMVFPFTVARRDIRGLLAFLVQYLELHSEAATGAFTAAEAEMREEAGHFWISARVWLAPFDLGLAQRFTLSASPTDVPAIYAITLSLGLLSGQRANWRRANRPFLRELRLQFLVWRTLTPQAMDGYRALGGDQQAASRLQGAGAGVRSLAGAGTLQAGGAASGA